jgi:uncharacterized protein (UPF0332 family)
MARTRLSQRQIYTRALFSVQQILLSRGFEIKKTDTVEKLLVTETNSEDDIWITLFKIYNNTKLRTELKNYLYKKIESHSDEIIKLLKHPKFKNEYNRFDKTFEWYAGELMINKFAAFSASFGVLVKDIMRNTTGTESGDFDSLVVLRDTNLAYFECKAGTFDKDLIMKCYERMLSLNCQFSILFCVEKINEEKLIWDTSTIKIPVVNCHQLNKIKIKGKQNLTIYDLHNCYFIDMSGNVENKLRTALRINAAKINQLHFGIGLDNETFNTLGYDIQTIDFQGY